MKTSEKQFNVFKKECEKWIAYFGLKNWRINYKLRKLDGETAAECDCNFDQHQVHITLNIEYASEWQWKDRDLKQYAFHEVCHILLERITFIAEARYVDDSEISEEIHSLIRLFENIIFDKGK